MSSSIRLRVYVGSRTAAPFIEEFNDLHKAAAESVAKRLRQDLAMLEANPSLRMGKQLSGRELSQTGQHRSNGSATRVLFERIDDTIVLYGTFKKSNDNDNTLAIPAAEEMRANLADAMATDPQALERMTEPLAIVHQPEVKRQPFLAVVSEDGDLGFLSTPVEVEVDDEPLEVQAEEPTGAARWEQQTRRQTERRAALEAEAARVREAAEKSHRLEQARIARLDQAAQRRVAEQQEAIEAEWRGPGFDTSLIREWQGLDEEIKYLREVAVPDEAERNAARLAPKVEVVTITSEPAPVALPVRRTLGSRLFRSRKAAAPVPEAPVEPQPTASEAPMETAARRRLAELESHREKVVLELGGQVLAARRRAVTALLEDQRGKAAKPTAAVVAQRRARQSRVAAAVARVSFEERLSMKGDAFAGLVPDRVTSPQVQAALAEVTKEQVRLKVPVGQGLAPEVAATVGVKVARDSLSG